MQDIKKFVINLKRRPDRLETFKKNCPFNDVEVIYGFDGKNVSSESMYREKNMIYKFKTLSRGEIGVFISHLRIFQRIISDSLDYAFIFEDDALFCPDFLDQINKIEIPSDLSILYVGGRFKEYFKMNSCIKISEYIVKHDQGKWIGDDKDRTLHAYIISKNMAQHCINEFYKSPSIQHAIDDWIINICKKHTIPIYNTYPLLCHSPLTGDSDIR